MKQGEKNDELRAKFSLLGATEDVKNSLFLLDKGLQKMAVLENNGTKVLPMNG